MRPSISGVLLFSCAALVPLGAARAQEAPSEAAPSQTAAPAEAPARLSYDEYRLSELEFLAKRSRIALYSTSAAAAVGIALVTPAFVNECVRVASSSSFDDIRCSNTGRVLLGVGVPFLAAGVLGILISGTMLGVRQGKIRHIEDRMAYEKSRAVRWDPSRSVFVF